MQVFVQFNKNLYMPFTEERGAAQLVEAISFHTSSSIIWAGLLLSAIALAKR